jgi:hypothetical protein
MSGKLTSVKAVLWELDKLIDFFVRNVDATPGGADERRIEAEPAFGANRLRLFDRVFDARENEFARGAPPARSRFMQAAMQVARQVD